MFHLIYLSRVRFGLDKAQWRTLLEQSRVKNPRFGITGLLLHHEGRILQVLEGEERAVRALYDVIRADPRHENCTTLLEEPILSRHYPQWPMAFRDLTSTADSLGRLPDAPEGLPVDLSEAQQALLHLHFQPSRTRTQRLAA